MSSQPPSQGARPPVDAGGVAEPRPSASVLLLSAANEVLLLHRVKSSTSFASAHVFPGGNLDAFHDGEVPPPGSPDRHRDGPAYRLAAVRECFEETGILLAKKGGTLVNLPASTRDEMRVKIHANKVSFADWVRSLGAEPDTNLIPFTRWITPTAVPKRFTTQMYIYMLPISRARVPSEMLIPTPDGGIEHTAAQFAPAAAWLQRAREGAVMLFPPQHYLLHMLAGFAGATTASLEEGPLHFSSQRKKLLAFLRRVPTADLTDGDAHATARIPWADKVMCPHNLLVRAADGRLVLGLEKPGPELEGSARGGDWDRVALVRFTKSGPRDVDIRRRVDILREEREAATAGDKVAKL